MIEQTQELMDVVKQGLYDYEAATSADQDERNLAIDDMIFAYSEDGQWDDLAKQRRRNKPRYTINKIAAAVNEIVGGYRQNRFEPKARPEQDQSKEEVEVYQGLIRSIMGTQNAKLAKDSAFKQITVGGFSALKVINKYSPGNPFLQDVCLEPIYDAVESVWFDPFSMNPTASDARFAFQTVQMDREEFKSTYPDASMIAWDDSGVIRFQADWGIGSRRDSILVADYYVKEEYDSVKVLLTNGDIMESEDFNDVEDELAEEDIYLEDERKTTDYKVMHYRMSGSEILEEPIELPTKHLPLVRVLGYYEWSEGVLHYRGIVRSAKDPQRVYNYATSANIEEVALKPKDKVMGTAKNFKGHESGWRNINTSDSPIVTITPDDSMPGGVPIPLQTSQPNMGLIQQTQQAELDLQSTIGRRSPAQGEAPADRSGRAIMALQRQDDATTYEMEDNLAQSLEQACMVAVDMIPTVYDTERQIMIVGADNETKVVTINNTITDVETGEEKKVFDTGLKYKINIGVTPSYETQRTEAVNLLGTLMQDPELKPLAADLMVKNMDFPYAEELTARIRKRQLQAGIVEPNEEEQAEMMKAQQTPEAQEQAQLQQQVQQMQVKQQMLLLEKTELENRNLEANIANLNAAAAEKAQSAAKDNASIEGERVDSYQTMVDSMVKKMEAGGIVTPKEVEVMNSMLELLDATVQSEMNRRIEDAVAKNAMINLQNLQQ